MDNQEHREGFRVLQAALKHVMHQVHPKDKAWIAAMTELVECQRKILYPKEN